MIKHISVIIHFLLQIKNVTFKASQFTNEFYRQLSYHSCFARAEYTILTDPFSLVKIKPMSFLVHSLIR